MSWKGFTKAINRAGTSVMAKTGAVERTDDNEFADLASTTKNLEKQTVALQKEAKAYLDAMRGITASQLRIAESVELFYTDASESAIASNAYKRATDDLDGRVARDLDPPFRATVLEPIGKLTSYFPEINKNIEKRNKKVRRGTF